MIKTRFNEIIIQTPHLQPQHISPTWSELSTHIDDGERLGADLGAEGGSAVDGPELPNGGGAGALVVVLADLDRKVVLGGESVAEGEPVADGDL